MKNLKKALAIMVVFAMVLSTVAFAAPADVEGTDYEDAVVRLLALEIVSGFPDGDFQPEGKVTRAQMAKMIMTALGAGEAAKYGGATDFSDVAADHWGSGYIQMAADRDVITGYGDGTFGPEDEVTYAQAVTMIVRALGYEQKAQWYGGYPNGYIGVAAEEGITDDVKVDSNLPANRGNVALMLDQSLDVPMMVMTNWNPNDPDYDVDEDKTLLSEYLDVDEFEGYVTAVPSSDDKLDDNEFKMFDEDSEKTKTFTALGDMSLDKLLGVEVKVWADGDDAVYVNIETDDDELLFDALKEIKKEGEEFKLDMADKTYDLADDADIYVNFKEVDEDDIKDIKSNKANNEQGVYGYFILKDNEIVTANLFDFDKVYAGLVTKVEDEEIEIKRGGKDLDLEDYDDGIYVYDKNFNAIDVGAIDVDSVVYAWEHEDDDIVYIVVVNEMVTGQLEEAKNDKVKVDGTKYDISKHLATYSANEDEDREDYADASSLDDLMGEDVDAVLDLIGAARHLRGASEATSDVVFALYRAKNTASFANQIKVFAQSGEELVYEFEKGSDFDFLFDYAGVAETADAVGKNTLIAFKLNNEAEIAENEIYVLGIDSSAASLAWYARTPEKLAEFGEDYELVFADIPSAANVGAMKFDGDSIVYDADGILTDTDEVYMEEDSVVFNIDSDNEAELMTWDDIKGVGDADVKASRGEIIIKKAKGLDVVAAVFDGIDDAATDFYYGVVTAALWSTPAGWKVTANVFEEGKDEFFLANDSDRSKLKKGSIFKFKLNSDNEMTDISTTVDGDEVVVVERSGEWLTFDTTSDPKWYQFDSESVVYLLKDNADIDEEWRYDEVDAGHKVKYFHDKDDKEITALVVLTENTENDPEGDTSGDVEVTALTGGDLSVTGDVYDSAKDNQWYIKVKVDGEPSTLYQGSYTAVATDDDGQGTDDGFKLSDCSGAYPTLTAGTVYEIKLYRSPDFDNPVWDKKLMAK